MRERTFSIAVIVDSDELQRLRPDVLHNFERSRDRLIAQLGVNWSVSDLDIRETSVSEGREKPRICISAACVATEAGA